MKKLIATLLTIACVMTLFSIFAFAETAQSSGDFTYEVKGNGTATITGYSGEQTDIILPNMIDGYTITSIGDLAFYSEEFRGESISVTIPDSVVSIGEKAFWNRNVRSINLPDGLESIGYGAFVGCDECQFRVSANHPYFAVVDGSLYNKTQKELLWPAEGATIPEGIVSIGDYAFYGQQGGDDIVIIPSSVQSIGNYAFSEMSYPDKQLNLVLQLLLIGQLLSAFISGQGIPRLPFLLQTVFSFLLIFFHPTHNRVMICNTVVLIVLGGPPCQYSLNNRLFFLFAAHCIFPCHFFTPPI